MSEELNNKPQPRASVAYEIFEWIETILVPFSIIVLIFAFSIRLSTVDGKSMLPTLHHGEYLMVNKLFYTPEYNDIVVVYAKDLINDDGGLGKPIVKRVIGLPGDRIFIDVYAGFVYRNGELLEVIENDGVLYEDGHMINSYTNSGEITSEVLVPENSVYVLGDNRNNSKDSRFYDVGMVDNNYIIGEAILRVLPFDSFGTLQ